MPVDCMQLCTCKAERAVAPIPLCARGAECAPCASRSMQFKPHTNLVRSCFVQPVINNQRVRVPLHPNRARNAMSACGCALPERGARSQHFPLLFDRAFLAQCQATLPCQERSAPAAPSWRSRYVPAPHAQPAVWCARARYDFQRSAPHAQSGSTTLTRSLSKPWCAPKTWSFSSVSTPTL